MTIDEKFDKLAGMCMRDTKCQTCVLVGMDLCWKLFLDPTAEEIEQAFSRCFPETVLNTPTADADHIPDGTKMVQDDHVAGEHKKVFRVTETPTNNTERMLNYSHAKDGNVFVYDASGKERELTEYMAELVKDSCGISAEDIMEGACFECCGCEAMVFYTIGVQAAELREMLRECEEREKAE